MYITVTASPPCAGSSAVDPLLRRRPRLLETFADIALVRGRFGVREQRHALLLGGAGLERLGVRAGPRVHVPDVVGDAGGSRDSAERTAALRLGRRQAGARVDDDWPDAVMPRDARQFGGEVGIVRDRMYRHLGRRVRSLADQPLEYTVRVDI